MLLEQIFLTEGALLGIWQITETPDELASQLSAQTLAENRFTALKPESRKTEYLATRCLLKTLCGEEKQIAYTKHGKPFLPDKSYHISISHTKNYAAVLLHPQKEVGIDIEQISNKILRLKERFMSSAELASLQPGTEVLQTLLHWSAKETLFKLLPETGIDFRSHLHIRSFEPQTTGTCVARETRSEHKQEFEIHYRVSPAFVLTWAFA
ncbi:MAG: 4'-phosphopantetheinyl transferase superfamily protein [Prevotellaceae bacterium]|jgi:phosphopantetheinyl transferase|nr:4'-phosphopantetheinyl transferase superfamily protein [Prevotellaceae bacterium]